MIPIIGQTQRLRYESPERAITCKTCGQEQMVGAAIEDGATCSNCASRMCVYCGCTDSNGCVRPTIDGGYACEWEKPGVCNFCHLKLIEEVYLMITDRREMVYARYEEPQIITL